jgi:glyoxylase-like metal-dependent hydrolase (beta-lactamase superfamily II)
MIFEQLRTGGDRNFSYLVGDEETMEAMVVDPSYEPHVLLSRARELNLHITTIVHTHGHADHVAGTEKVCRPTGARVLAFRGANAGGAQEVADGETIEVGKLHFRVIHTPGHTRDSICLLGAGKLLTGDTLFVGKVGGTGYGEDARWEYESLHQKLMVLPNETEVWPGHDFGVRPSSTIGDEKRQNPFILCADFDEFVHLKRTWPEYKRKHGIA